MSFEITNTIKTLRNEGCASFVNKLGQYFSHFKQAYSFLRDKTADPLAKSKHPFLGQQQKDSEIKQLYEIVAARQPRSVLEIGTAGGGTLFLWCQAAHPQATIVSIDLPCGIHGGGYPKWKSLVYKKFKQPRQTLKLIRGNSHSHKALQEVVAYLPNIDLLFIDGGHRYMDVLSDFYHFLFLVRPGGMIVFHDIVPHTDQTCQVDKFWQEIKGQFKTQEIVEDWNQKTCGIGIIYKS